MTERLVAKSKPNQLSPKYTAWLSLLSRPLTPLLKLRTSVGVALNSRALDSGSFVKLKGQ